MKTSLVDRLKASENEIFGAIYIERKGAIDYSVSLENFGNRFAFVKDIKISGNHSEKYQTLIKKRILEEVEKEYGYVGETVETSALYAEYSDRIWFSPDITVIKTCPKDTWKKVATTLENVDFFVSGDLVFTSNSVALSKTGIYIKDEEDVCYEARFLTDSELDSRQVLLYSLSRDATYRNVTGHVGLFGDFLCPTQEISEHFSFLTPEVYSSTPNLSLQYVETRSGNLYLVHHSLEDILWVSDYENPDMSQWGVRTRPISFIKEVSSVYPTTRTSITSLFGIVLSRENAIPTSPRFLLRSEEKGMSTIVSRVLDKNFQRKTFKSKVTYQSSCFSVTQKNASFERAFCNIGFK